MSSGNMTDNQPHDELEAAIYEKVEQGYLRVVGRSDDGELLFQETECAERWRACDADLATAREDRDAYKALYDDLHEATGCVDGYAVDQLRADLATARILASEAAASGRFDALLGHLLASVPPPTSGEEP